MTKNKVGKKEMDRFMELERLSSYICSVCQLVTKYNETDLSYHKGAIDKLIKDLDKVLNRE